MKKNLLSILAAALVVAGLLSPFASSFPDGLERVAEDLGFIDRVEGIEVISAPIPDYVFPGIGNERTATAVAGILGTLAVFGAAYGLGKIISAGKQKENN